MLHGRREERALVAGLLAAARGGRAGVLVVRGEAGIGKSALLDDAAEQAAGFRVLRAAGAEGELELPFAGLHQLLRPVLDRLGRLPAPQAGALRGAFGLVDGETNPFLVELGVLTLLAEVAGERPLLCLVDSAQWLDQASAGALLFAARRWRGERVALLLAARDSLRRFDAPGLPSLRLEGLDREAAGRLLEARAGELAPAVRERLVAESGGNPLALLELPATLSGQLRSGSEPLPELLPLSARLQQAFLQQVRSLPAATQRLLLVAAAEGAGELAAILEAGHRLAVEPSALLPAERAGLVQVAGQDLRFRHPLVRSAVYQAATFTARQAVHRALIRALADERHADRRAWHLAADTLGRDERVAAALEASGDRARRRGGPAAAAAALERAAGLTPEAAPRARRLVAAAELLWEAGHTGRAMTLLDRTEPSPADPAVQARRAHLRGHLELACGNPATACTVLVEGARPILETDPERATGMLVLAAWAALAGNQLDRIVDEIGPAIASLPGEGDVRVGPVADSLFAFGLGSPTMVAGAQELPRKVTTTWPHPAFTWVWPMLLLAEPAGEDVTAEQRYARLVATRRAAGTVGTLTVALANLAIVEASLGRWRDAIANATEGLRLARETGQEATVGYFLVMLAAIAANQGRAEDCRRLADEALAVATTRRVAVVAAYAAWTLALLDLTEGRPAPALERLRALHTPQHPTAHATIALLATGTMVEAAARANRLDGMEPHVARFERWAEWDRRTWNQVVARRCRALVSEGEEAERHYRAALATDGLEGLPYELARTELLYGEWLRRGRRRADARVHLHAAMALFTRLGATPWGERARGELRASGETARKRDPSTSQQLTPQELQVARLASQGLSNQEIAERLFVSRHTVGYHLHKVYAKLGIASRAHLRRLDLNGGRGAPRRSRLDPDAVLDLGDARRGPGGPLRLLLLRPRAHGARQDDLVALDVHLDPLGVRLGAADQRLLDAPLQLGGCRPPAGPDRDEVAHPADARQAADHPLGLALLELPLDLATKGDPAVGDGHVQVLDRQGRISFQGAGRRRGDVGVGALRGAGQPHLDVVGDRFDPATRWAASFAAHFLVEASTQPVRVTTPSLTMTPISLGCTRASHFSSSRTSSWICSSVSVPGDVAMARSLLRGAARPFDATGCTAGGALVMAWDGWSSRGVVRAAIEVLGGSTPIGRGWDGRSPVP
jgi:DNA-binding CsgD family transcriptional regulator